MSARKGGTAVLLLLGFSACSSVPDPSGDDIVRDTFPDAQAAIRATKEAVAEAFENCDGEALQSLHLNSPKFTKFGSQSDVRMDFEAMNAQEAAGLAIIEELVTDVSIDFRDLKVDVFGDVAVATSYPLISGTSPHGLRIEFPLRLTDVFVRTDDGWKIAHEHATSAPDIVTNPFPLDQAAIRAQMEALDDTVNQGDWDGLRSDHLPGPKFSKLQLGSGRQDFDEMIAEETAILSAVRDFSIDWRDLRIDVFGDVAIATALPVYSWSQANGESTAIEALATMVWVKTNDGWKIAHEHNTLMDAE